MTNTAPKLNVVISPVQDVSLIATADANYWTERLAPLGLTPTIEDGRAQLVVTCAEMKFKGIRFRELSVSVFVVRGSGPSRDGVYLLQAWNSNRFFAWVERTFFHTPYAAGDVRLDLIPPEAVGVYRNNLPLFSAMMGRTDPAAPRSPDWSAYQHWEGPIFLPGSPPRLFYARLSGETVGYSFRSDFDALTIQPTPEFPALQQLLDSDFRGREWWLRSSATHAKGKTVARSASPFLDSPANVG